MIHFINIRKRVKVKKVLLKDLIADLQEIYNTFPKEYFTLVGEPEVVIDGFKQLKTKTFSTLFTYTGVSPNINIDRTYDGSCLVMTSIKDRASVNNPPKKIIKKGTNNV